ncbi:MAG: hypothetical protein EYC68_10055 [Chloroflexota bacterium]|nr:MAG: hypothetical protein EYC68_10055 [Chloroflexota bacterium]
MSLNRFVVAFGTITVTIFAFVLFSNSAPIFAAAGNIEKDATTIQLAPPQQNPTLIPQTTPDTGGIPPIDLGSLLGGDTPTPTASAEGATKPVIENDFSACDVIEDEFFKVECLDGQLNFTRKDVRGTRWIYYRPELGDAVIEVTTRLPNADKNARYGVIFRLDDTGNNYYVFGVTNQGKYGLFRYAGDHYETIIPYTDSLNVGNASFPTKIKLVNQGDVIAINLGGQWVDSVRDPNLKAGRVALFTEPDEPNQTVLFDDLKVSEILSPLPVPEPRVIQSAATPTSISDVPVIDFGTTPTAAAPQPTQTPFIIVVTATPEPATAIPTRAPTQRPTQEAETCPAGPNEAVLYISNNYSGTTMRFTIGGGEWGTHDYDVPGDGQYYFIRMPPGKYTYTAFIAGKGKANGERMEYKAGQCYSLRFSP